LYISKERIFSTGGGQPPFLGEKGNMDVIQEEDSKKRYERGIRTQYINVEVANSGTCSTLSEARK